MTAALRLRTKLVLITTTLVAALGGIYLLLARSVPHPAPVWLLLVAAVAGAAILSAGATRHLTASVTTLLKAVHRWTEGDLAYRAAIRSHDETQSLGDALNRMVAAIQHRDESVRLDTDERLRQAERLATVGHLAAGVAHEINNPLGGILLYANLILESMPEDDPRRPNLLKIVAQAGRAQEIVRGLLDFARQTPPAMDRVDLNHVLREVLDLLERQPQLQNITLRTETCGLPLWVRIDAQKMQQVFINIVMNALDAMPNGGTLTVRSGFSERDGFCRVAITDTGVGVKEEDLPRIFEPFFTTKAVGKGVGLGLSISYGIVQQHGGDIEVQSAPGQGTTIRVLLPVEMVPDLEPIDV